MAFSLDKNRPICPQLVEFICVLLSTEVIKPNQKLMSVRDFALKYGVNPNTVQKSFEQLDQMGLIYSVRGSGWYAGENIALAKKTADEIKNRKISAFFGEMERLGFSAEQTKEIIKEWN